MKKSNIWWLVLIILVVAVALFVALNIDHPAWAENLLFWQPVGQRDIALRQGLDLQGAQLGDAGSSPSRARESRQSVGNRRFRGKAARGHPHRRPTAGHP
jgi:hypothetical protein